MSANLETGRPNAIARHLNLDGSSGTLEMLTSPGWYVAICCVPTLVASLSRAVGVLLLNNANLGQKASHAASIASTALTLALFGYGIWHFGLFAGVGVVAISLLCILLIGGSVTKLITAIAERRIERYRQALIRTVAERVGATDDDAMAAAVGALEYFDDADLREFADKILQSKQPRYALLAGIVSQQLGEMGYDEEECRTVLMKSDARQLSNLWSWLTVDEKIQEDEAVDDEIVKDAPLPGSDRLRPKAKTRRRRGAKRTLAATLMQLRSEPPSRP
jgi:hypothetical protein